MATKVPKTYLYNLISPGVFAEFYFPRRVSYQAEVIKALEEGISEEVVKTYFHVNASDLIKELIAYPVILDPERYMGRKTELISITDARRRIKMYKHNFYGWSTYNVEGVFLNTKAGELQDELTQVIRVIFRFESQLEITKKKEVEGIVQSITAWLLSNYRLAFPVLNETQRDRFISEHSPLRDIERTFAQNHYMVIATEVLKWFDDCALFTFGYLARRFWNQVANVGRREDEIWVTSFFSAGINVLQPGK